MSSSLCWQAQARPANDRGTSDELDRDVAQQADARRARRRGGQRVPGAALRRECHRACTTLCDRAWPCRGGDMKIPLSRSDELEPEAGAAARSRAASATASRQPCRSHSRRAIARPRPPARRRRARCRRRHDGRWWKRSKTRSQARRRRCRGRRRRRSSARRSPPMRSVAGAACSIALRTRLRHDRQQRLAVADAATLAVGDLDDDAQPSRLGAVGHRAARPRAGTRADRRVSAAGEPAGAVREGRFGGRDDVVDRAR